MNITVAYRFVVEASREDQVLGNYALSDVDFEPAVQWAHLQNLRLEIIGPETGPVGASIEPITCAERGAPYISGFEVLLVGSDAPVAFGTTFLHETVVRDASNLVQQGALQPGARFTYRICAFPEPLPTHKNKLFDFDLEAAPARFEIGAAALPVYNRSRGMPIGEDDLPVVFMQSVLDEAERLAASAGELETGGILLGGLRRDADTSVLFVEVSALITAPRSTGTATSLHLGPDTFAAVEEILNLRDLGEIMVGWWHSHPCFCARCPLEQRSVCAWRKPFFSEADRDVHRTLFPQAFSLALLISDLGHDQPSIDLFAWRQGLIAQRGFLTSDKPAVRQNTFHHSENSSL